MESMAVTMLTPRDVAVEAAVDAPAPAAGAVTAAGRWRRSALRMMTRRNLLPWLAVKSVLTALVFSGEMTVWTAFVLDTVVSVAVIAYGWRLARREAGPGPGI
jgi:cation transport ATPase